MDAGPEKPRLSPAQKLAAALPYAWLLVLFLVPLLIVLKISFSQSAIAQPPYTPLLQLDAGWRGIEDFLAGLSLDNYRRLGSDPLYVLSYVKSLEIAAFSTLLLLSIAYPIAYGITRTPRRLQAMLIALVVLPFWLSLLIRGYAWVNVLQHDGLLNRFLLALHIVRAPPVWLGTDAAIYIGIVYAYLPVMVLPLYAVLARLDHALIETAVDLGCPRWKALWLVTLPLSSPGVLAGVLVCFIPIVGEFVIPDLLGGSRVPMIGQTIWMEFFGNRNWPAAAAVAIVLVCLLATPIVLLGHQTMGAEERN
jgi:putrescine transport system permease protein